MLVVGMILFVGGILALVNPGGTFTALEIMLGIVALFEGIVLVFKYYKIKNILDSGQKQAPGLA